MPPTSSLMTSDLSSSDETMSSISLAGTSSRAQTPSTSSSVNRPAKAPRRLNTVCSQSSRGRSSIRLPLEASDDAGGRRDLPRSEGKAIIQATEDLPDRQHPGPHRRQRQTVKPPANADDRDPVRVAQLEMARRGRPRPPEP